MRKLFAVALVACLVLTACRTASGVATWCNSAKTAVVILTDVWDFSMMTLGAAYRSGMLSEENKTRAISIGEVTRKALLVAASAIDAGDAQGFAAQMTAIANAVQQLSELLKGAQHANATSGTDHRYRGPLPGTEKRRAIPVDGRGSFRGAVERYAREALEEQRGLFRSAAFDVGSPSRQALLAGAAR